MDEETRTYLDEMRRDAGQLREDLRLEMRETVQVLRGEIREGAEVLRGEIRGTAEETRRHFGVIAEGLRGDIRLVAEGVLANAAAIERLRSEIFSEMEIRFAVVQHAFVDVRRDIEELRARP